MKTLRAISLTAVLAMSAAFSASAEFYHLFRVGKGSGKFEVLRPGCETNELGIAKKAYPYGTKLFVGQGQRVYIFLAPDQQVHLINGAEAVIADAGEGDSSRGPQKLEITLEKGSLETLFPNLEEARPVLVKTPTLKAESIGGRLMVWGNPQGRPSRVRLVEGVATVSLLDKAEIIPSKLTVGSDLIITTTETPATETETASSYTQIDGKGNETEVLLKRGCGQFAAKLRSGVRAKIWRTHADLGGRLAVSVLVDAAPIVSYAYLDGKDEVIDNSPGAVPTSEEGAEVSEETDAETPAEETSFGDFGDEGSETASDEPAAADSDDNLFF